MRFTMARRKTRKCRMGTSAHAAKSKSRAWRKIERKNTLPNPNSKLPTSGFTVHVSHIACIEIPV